MRILSADWVIPVEGEPIAEGALAIGDDGRIAAVGTSGDLGAGERFDGCVIAPGFVNCHSHLEYAVYAGFGDGLPFVPWIGLHIRRKERIELDDMRAIATVGAWECLRSGITTVGDCSFAGAAAEAAAETKAEAAPTETKAPAAPVKGLGIAAGAKRPGAKKPAAPPTPTPAPEAKPEAKANPEAEETDGEAAAPAAPVKGLGIAPGARPPGKR